MRRKRIGVAAAAFVVTFALWGAGAGLAGNSLLDQGASLLNTLNKSGSSDASEAGSLTNNEIVSGLKEALEKGAGTVIRQLGTQNGFNSDASIHIPLPAYLSKTRLLLDQAGLGAYADEVELKLNRAAEAATPKAKELFVNAISRMSFDDARSILNGPDDAATQYFKKTTSGDLTEAFTPVVEDTLQDIGAVKAYDQMMAKYKSMPLVPDLKGNLTNYAVEEALNGIFYYLAKEEKAIRENPAKQTTELLKKLFN